jgi:hypothetical protein
MASFRSPVRSAAFLLAWTFEDKRIDGGEGVQFALGRGVRERGVSDAFLTVLHRSELDAVPVVG